MFKLMGAAVMMIAAGLFGMAKYSELYERKRILIKTFDGAQKIKNGLRLLCMPLDECFSEGGGIFEKAAHYIRKGEIPSTAIEMAIGEEKCLKKGDREIFMRFASGLSAYDCEGQIANIEHFLSEIKREAESAEGELKTKGTLFIKGSLLLGGAIVLILI